jgi:hypothetical protein
MVSIPYHCRRSGSAELVKRVYACNDRIRGKVPSTLRCHVLATKLVSTRTEINCPTASVAEQPGVNFDKRRSQQDIPVLIIPEKGGCSLHSVSESAPGVVRSSAASTEAPSSKGSRRPPRCKLNTDPPLDSIPDGSLAIDAYQSHLTVTIVIIIVVARGCKYISIPLI